jgi:hypothetical protein
MSDGLAANGLTWMHPQASRRNGDNRPLQSPVSGRSGGPAFSVPHNDDSDCPSWMVALNSVGSSPQLTLVSFKMLRIAQLGIRRMLLLS